MIRPSRISSSRWQRSASSITWLDTSTAAPPSAIRWNSSHRSRRSTGSRPTVGSSSSSSRGEPTSALDPVGRRIVRGLLEGLRERGVAVLLNSHLLSEVELVCDRVAIIARGSLIKAGTPAELAGPGGVEVETDAGVRLVEGAGREDAPRIVAELVAAGERVYRVEVRHSSLEEVYLEAVGGETG